jgi:ribosome-binding factor A
MAKHRQERINAELRRVLSDIFMFDIPLQQDNIVSVIRVDTTKDLEEAKVYLSIFRNKEEVLKKLESSTPYIRHLIGQKMKIRRIPKLKFIVVDESSIIV